MKAARYHDAGDPTVVQIDEIPKPSPGDDELVVRVKAASINPTDAKRRERGVGPVPKITGSDFAGTVTAVGDDVREFNIGDRVCGTGLHTTRFQQGSFAEYVNVPLDVVSTLPDDVSFAVGASVALVGVTAWRGLIDHGCLEPTQSCLIHGGTGGVGHVAVQLASALETTVITTASPEREQEAFEFGADEVIPYTVEDLGARVQAIEPNGVDVVFDHRAFDYFTTDCDVAAFSGSVVLYGGVNGTVELSPAALRNNLSISVMTMSNLSTKPSLPSVSSVLDRVLELTASEVLQPTIARTYSLEDAAEMHRAILEDSFVGKLIVHP